ncbi:ImmA/IrrE family metallo-endopeptidase [Nocardia fluminea]|uniref:ImmA/IrrE family metallo-endopeptidase n=1 Tax=Nocardia fluminea TaxID=134984 RepID=UPI00371C7C16
MLIKTRVPAAIVLAPSYSTGRQLFSLGHEFCHFLIGQDAELADLLFEEPDEGRALEEDICDAFAAMVLIDDALVKRSLDGGVTASNLVRLFEASRASRAACAIAVSEYLKVPGYVIIAEVDRAESAVRTRIAAGAHGVLPIRHGTVQEGTLLEVAARTGHARGTGQLRFASGAYTDTFHCDVICRGGYVFAVMVNDGPAWESLSVHPGVRGGFDHEYCAHCSAEFYPAGTACQLCGSHTCSTCRRCSCEAAAPPRARVCKACFLERPGTYFDGDSCLDCTG